MPFINLESSDGDMLKVDVDVITCSLTIKQLIDNLGVGDDSEVVPLKNISTEILQKVITWAEHHKDDLPSIEDDEDPPRERRTDDITTWDANFIKMEQIELFDLIVAANYLDITGLLDLGCKIVANMIKGKTADDIRAMFNLVNDLTPQEEEQIRKENEWCEEK
ncbi:S-phase kinase-associated protein 1 isoform X2 [Folsomia candida]|uniref:S-phase kinase-associated protein 1 n=2 Tax=Folsomia candida TaxID=158441 RepID=A0A226F4N4_FOLCA|nr:S-phase kinase-associated protein 1 isoform X2 [Folsomia candida]XP_035712283.1 S-phase kinase-associated protein 1 isoform X2 [Folsomia candida]OXA64765.1 S-phase kinase-associated protein 1 [Folsomia candida]